MMRGYSGPWLDAANMAATAANSRGHQLYMAAAATAAAAAADDICLRADVPTAAMASCRPGPVAPHHNHLPYDVKPVPPPSAFSTSPLLMPDMTDSYTDDRYTTAFGSYAAYTATCSPPQPRAAAAAMSMHGGRLESASSEFQNEGSDNEHQQLNNDDPG